MNHLTRSGDNGASMDDVWPDEGNDLCLQCGGYRDGYYIDDTDPPGFYCEECLLDEQKREGEAWMKEEKRARERSDDYLPL